MEMREFFEVVVISVVVVGLFVFFMQIIPSYKGDGSGFIIANLTSKGFIVKFSGTVEQPFISVKGRVFAVNNDSMQIFEFENAALADAFAATVSSDGARVGDTFVTWIGQPHFYRYGNVVVIYLGNDAGVAGALQDILGKQFAGGLIEHYCSPASRGVGACITLYKPVCGWFDGAKIKCIKYPCAQTFSNGCFACIDDKVLYWTEGECPK